MKYRSAHPLVVTMSIACALAGVAGCSSNPSSGINGLTGESIAGSGGLGATAGASGSDGVAGSVSVGGNAGTGVVDGVSGTGGAGGSAGDAADAGTGDAGGAGGSGGAGGTGGGPKPKCLQKDSQVVVLGDSYINWVSHTMPQDMKTVSGQNWRMYAIGAASMATGGASFIPDQLPKAIMEDPDMRVIVMDGGGNDILVPDANIAGSGDCKMRTDSPTLPQCQMIVQKAIDKAESLMDLVIKQGVTDVIFFFYPLVPEGTLIGGAHPRAILQYALPKVREACEGAEMRNGGKLKCHFIDTIPIFQGHDDWFAPTDIHENSMGSMAITKAIWKVMQDNCIAQKSPNTCCEN